MDEQLDKALNDNNNKHLLNLNSVKIRQMTIEIIDTLDTARVNKKSIVEKLDRYRYIDEINELKYGNYLRWISLDDEKYKLNKGAIFCELNISDNGINVMCKSFASKYFQINLDSNIIFQRLSDQELVLISALDYMSK